MNVFELMYFLALLALIIYPSRRLGHLWGVADWILMLLLIGLLILLLRFFTKMNVRALLALAGLLCFVIFGARLLGSVCGVTDWLVVIPLTIALALLAFGWIGKSLGKGRRNSIHQGER
jgi:hypothetical protein